MNFRINYWGLGVLDSRLRGNDGGRLGMMVAGGWDEGLTVGVTAGELL